MKFIPSNKNILQSAVELWCKDKKRAIELYGDIITWDTKQDYCYE